MTVPMAPVTTPAMDSPLFEARPSLAARIPRTPTTIEAQDTAMSPRGYRLLAGISRLQFAHIDRLVRSFGTLQALLASSAADLQAIEGIGGIWARHIREGLSRLAETSLDRFD